MLSQIRLSSHCSSSSFWLICYRRARRFWLNAWGDFLTFFGFSLPHLSAKQLVQRAQLSESSLGGLSYKLLESLCSGWDQDANLTFSGRILLKEYYTDLLETRKKIQNIVKDHPEIVKIPMEKPLFIVGWPRVGSTFLHNLLSCDPRVKGPPLWQLVAPAQDLFIDEQRKSQRIQQTAKFLDYYYDLEPCLFMLHEMFADRPDECCHLFEQNFIDRHSPLVSDCLSEYVQVLQNLTIDELKEIYEIYKLTLQVMAFANQDHPPSHHVLKDSTHCILLPGIFQVFPDAKILVLHREPSNVFHSCVAGIGLVARYYYKLSKIDLAGLSARVLEWMRLCQQGIHQTRQQTSNPQAFLDIEFKQLVKDPINTVKQIYQYFGYEYTAEFEANMNHYLQQNSEFRTKKPNHICEFPASTLPLSDEQINQMFDDFSASS